MRKHIFIENTLKQNLDEQTFTNLLNKLSLIPSHVICHSQYKIKIFK